MRRVEALRVQRSWTKNFLAKVALVNRGRVSLITSGAATPPPGGVELKRLAIALDWPADRAFELLDELDGPEPAAQERIPASCGAAPHGSAPTTSLPCLERGGAPTATDLALQRACDHDRAAV